MANVSAISNRPNMAEPAKLFIDIMIVLAVSGLVFVLEDLAFTQGWIPFGTELRGAISVFAGAITAVAVVLARGGTLAELGFRQPKSWAGVPFQVTAILTTFIAAQSLVPLLISAFIDLPETDFSRYDSIAGNLGAAIGMALILPLTASIPEEVIYRGFLIGRLSKIFGEDIRGASLSVLFQALVFGSIHFQWGIGGMIMTFLMGAIWGSAYLLCGRNLWVVILAHSAGHLILVTQLYFGTPIIA